MFVFVHEDLIVYENNIYSCFLHLKTENVHYMQKENLLFINKNGRSQYLMQFHFRQINLAVVKVLRYERLTAFSLKINSIL